MGPGSTTQRERVGPSPALPAPVPAGRGRRVKFALDRVVAAVAIVLTAPLFLLLAVALLALGERRVLRTQTRVGERGSFALVSVAVPSARPRVARVLAGSGLAVLPQLFNLLRGDVSLVGPRPRYPGEPRPPARPGMAGLAQLEQATRILDRDAVFALDAEYAQRWSLGLDLRVVAASARRLLGPGGER